MPRRKLERVVPSYASYLFEIEEADPDYSLSTAVPKWETGNYSEYWHLGLFARCLAPAKVSGRRTRIVLLANRKFFDRAAYADRAWRPLGVAHLTMRGDRSEVSASVPFDSAWGIASGVSTGLFKYIHMDGEQLKRGTAQISFVSFRATYDPDDYTE